MLDASLHFVTYRVQFLFVQFRWWRYEVALLFIGMRVQHPHKRVPLIVVVGGFGRRAEHRGELVENLTVFGMRNCHQSARGPHRRVEKVVLDTHMDIQLDQKLVEQLLAFSRSLGRGSDSLTVRPHDVVVVDEYIESFHCSTPFDDATGGGTPPLTSIIPSQTLAE